MKRICNLQTIYAHGPTIYEKNQISLNPSSNCKVVKVKTDRVCAECGSGIPKGNSCYTLILSVEGDAGSVSPAYRNQG